MTSRPTAEELGARRLSDVIAQEDAGYGHLEWIVAGVSGYIPRREQAYALARRWYPELEDDEPRTLLQRIMGR